MLGKNISPENYIDVVGKMVGMLVGKLMEVMVENSDLIMQVEG